MREEEERTSDSNHIERCAAHPVTDVQANTFRLLRVVDGLFLYETHPPVLEFLSLVEYERDECAQVLNRKCGSGDAALTSVHSTLRGEHAASDEPFNDLPR